MTQNQTHVSYIGATGKKINNILKNAKDIRVVFTSDGKNYELESCDYKGYSISLCW